MPEDTSNIKHYYTRAANLYISFSVGRRELIDGELRRVDDRAAQFTPLGDGFGHFFTDDPELIKNLEKRNTEVGDVFDAAEYARQSIPASKRAEMLERELVQANTLIAKLQAEGKLKR